jgi:hypothetical protein
MHLLWAFLPSRSLPISEWVAVILVAAIGIFPIYIFPSGAVQFAHVLFALFAVVSFLSMGVPGAIWIQVLCILAVYVYIREYFYFLSIKDFSALLPALYLGFNISVAAGAFIFFRHNSLQSLAVGLGVAVLLIFGFYGFHTVEGSSGRFSASFNNPNQLGYFSVCLLSCSYLLYRARAISYSYALFLIFASIFFSFLSLSKAAIIPTALTFFIAGWPAYGAQKIKRAYCLLSLLTAVFFLGSASAGLLDGYDVISRIANMMDEDDTSLRARGYLALSGATIDQIIFGLGSEGSRGLIGHEVHSTLGSFAINYGLTGLAIFGGFISLWMVSIWRSLGFLGVACIVGPSMLYGLTHNGSRFSIFWILVGVSMAAVFTRPVNRAQT